MSPQSSSSYQPLPSSGSVDGSLVDEVIVVPSKFSPSARNSNWFIFSLLFLLLTTNFFWAWRMSHPPTWETQSSHTESSQTQLLPAGPDLDDGFNVREEQYPPVRRILRPIYQDTEFNEEGENKERANGLWKGLFPNGNGVISLDKSEAQERGLHNTADDPRTKGNALYIIAGFHTMHCVTVLRTSLWHYRLGDNQTTPWSHLVHCLDMIRQTLMCNMDTKLLWLHDPDTFADGQLHVCKDFWQLHEWADQHAG